MFQVNISLELLSQKRERERERERESGKKKCLFIIFKNVLFLAKNVKICSENFVINKNKVKNRILSRRSEIYMTHVQNEAMLLRSENNVHFQVCTFIMKCPATKRERRGEGKRVGGNRE